jgi:hypothetical protein
VNLIYLEAMIFENQVDSINPSPLIGITTIEIDQIMVDSVVSSSTSGATPIEELETYSIIPSSHEVSIESANNYHLTTAESNILVPSPSRVPAIDENINAEPISTPTKSSHSFATPVTNKVDSFLAITECDKSITVRRKKNKYSLAVDLVSSDNDIENFQVF